MRMRSRRMRVPAGRRLVSPGAGGAAGFTPASLSGLVLWLDPTYGLYQERTGAGAATLAAADGDPVGTWLARTGQYLTAPSDAARPTYKPNGGAPFLRSDGVDDMLATSSPVATSNLVSMFAVHRWVSGAGIVVHNGGADGVGLRYASTASGSVLYENVVSVSFSCEDPTTGFRLWQMRLDGGGLDVWTEGVARLTDDTTATPSLPTARTSVFDGGNLSTKSAACDVREVLIYNRGVTDSERSQLESYLQSRWGTV